MSTLQVETAGTTAELDPDALRFFRALDAVDHGIAFFGAEGRLVHANSVLARLLHERAGGVRLLEGLTEVALELFDATVSESREATGSGSMVARELEVEGDTYLLKAHRTTFGIAGAGETVLIAVEPPLDARLETEDLHARFGLSPQECRVAHALVQGRPNKEIAQELSVSPHTARHHTAEVLRKVGARSRTEVVSKILRLAPDVGG